MTPLDPQLQPPALVLTRLQRNTSRGARRSLQRSPRSSRKLLASAAVAAVASLVMLVTVFGVCWARRQRPLARGTASRSLSYTDDDSDELLSIIDQCLELEEEHGLHLPAAEHLEEREATQRLVAMLHASASAFEQSRSLFSSQRVQYEGHVPLSGTPQAVYMPAQQPSHMVVWGGSSGAPVAPVAVRMVGDVASFSPGVVPGGGVVFVSQQRQAPVASQSLQDQHHLALSGGPQAMYMPAQQPSHTAVWGGPSGATFAPVAGGIAGDVASFATEVEQGGHVGFFSHAHSSASYGGAEAGPAALPATIDDDDDAADDGSDASASRMVSLPLGNPDNASAAALSADAWLEGMVTDEFAPVVQQRTEAAPDYSLPPADVGRGPLRIPEEMGGMHGHEAVSVAASGGPAPATLMQRTGPSGYGKELSMSRVDLDLHPFVRLPQVDPENVRSCFQTEYALNVKVNMRSPMESFLQMRELFAMPSLTAEEVETLLYEAENLANYAKEKLTRHCNRRTSSYIFQKLSSLFMIFDCLVCTMEMVGDKMRADIWWDEFTGKFETDFNLPTRAKLPRTESLNRLINRLSVALSTYKQRKRPPTEEIIELKRLILTEQAKGSQLHHPLWRLWLEDDERFLRSWGILRKPPSDTL